MYVSDEAKRCSDIVNTFVAGMDYEELKRKWIAIKLEDGNFDGTLYDSKQDAVKAQGNKAADEFKCAYIAFVNIPNGITGSEAEVFLNYTRKAYEAGFRLPDPDAQHGGPDLFYNVHDYDRLVRNHVYRQVQQFARQIKLN